MIRRLLSVSILAVALAASSSAGAQGLRERLIAHIKEKSAEAQPVDPAQYLPGATRTEAAYGADPAQTLEIYMPAPASGANAHNAPVIVMVHGGGWRIGDKNSKGVVDNKLKHWLPQGFVLVSVDYRMLPEAPVDVQARDVASAVAYVEAHAGDWGGDGNRLILMGHSAGAHLVTLVSSDPAKVAAAGGHSWRGTVVLDSAALDVAHVMTNKHPKLYDDAFGNDPAFWASVSPTAQLKPGAVPMMLVCSLKRPDDSCGQSRAFADHLKAIGMDAPVVPQPLTHMEVNATLGLDGNYTSTVDAFIAKQLKN
jgi:acetyl esterase/lipase